MSITRHIPLLILGSGPAGWTAVTYAAWVWRRERA